MEPKEALRQIENLALDLPREVAWQEAVTALREKVAREEKPTWSLEILERQLRNCSVSENLRKYGDHSLHDAAADILKTLRERGGEVLTIWQRDTESAYSNAIALLRDLGVQPKEA